jgi:Ca2+-binding RTX toxin-like protein
VAALIGEAPVIFDGTADNDSFVGGAGADTAVGKGGADFLAGGAGADSLDGGDGPDRLFSGEMAADFAAYMPPPMDRGTEVDTLKGGDGSDYLVAGYGDNVDGGPDGDYGDYLYISFQGAPSGVTADFGLSTQTIGGGVITSIENISYVEGSNYDDNVNLRDRGWGYTQLTYAYGMAGNDTLTAGPNTYYISGGDGNDLLDGRASGHLNVLDGGAGNDTLYADVEAVLHVVGGVGEAGCVDPRPAVQHIIACAAGQGVVAGAAIEGADTRQAVIAVFAIHRSAIDADLPHDGVVARAALGAGYGVDQIVSVATNHMENCLDVGV